MYSSCKAVYSPEESAKSGMKRSSRATDAEGGGKVCIYCM